MIKIITSPINQQEFEELSLEIGGFFVKVVIDLEKRILAAGAKMHFDEEQELLQLGSKQQNLWGGGYDLDKKEITFSSIINNRPIFNQDDNIVDPKIREEFIEILKELFPI